jgi:hypothetical protein
LQKIESLKLPEQLPTSEALKSWQQNEHDYEPEFWEFQYEIYRYLKNINDKNLIERYRDIHRNFHVLVRPERNVIPVNSFLSSWYWYRKEHQTHYEFFLRNLPLPMPTPYPRQYFVAPIRPKGPNSGDILFRYGDSEFMRVFAERGEIRISPASVYKDGPVTDPRTDDELNIHRWLSGQHTRITTKEGKNIPVIGDVHETVSIPMNYYTLCMSCDFEPKMFEEFGYDSCVIIKDPEQFAARIENSSRDFLQNWYFHHNPIEYFDPYEPYKNQYLDPVMCKDFRFTYQMEYRFIWHPLNFGSAKDYVFLTIGALNDICDLYIIEKLT